MGVTKYVEELLRDSGWPNVCVFGRPCFIHTRYAWYCRTAAPTEITIVIKAKDEASAVLNELRERLR